MTLLQSAAAEVLRKFPNHPTKTLASILLRDNKSLFTGLEHARVTIRRLRGNSGEESRNESAITQFYRKNGHQRDTFAALPSGITSLGDWKPQAVSCSVALLLSDAHIPYHNAELLKLALQHGKDRKVDCIILNGDFMDFFSVSFWEKDPRQRNFAKELVVGKQVLQVIRRTFPKAQIIYKDGNHEERLQRYMRVKAPELLGVPEFEMPNLLDFKKYGIAHVTDMRVIKINQLNVIHGHEFRWGITSPVNPARGFYLRGKECCIGGHLHQTSEHTETTMNESVVTCWSTGCLCDMHPEYSPITKWNAGMATVEVYRDTWRVRNLKIRDGKVF